jgi:hypothetical protein
VQVRRVALSSLKKKIKQNHDFQQHETRISMKTTKNSTLLQSTPRLSIEIHRSARVKAIAMDRHGPIAPRIRSTLCCYSLLFVFAFDAARVDAGVAYDERSRRRASASHRRLAAVAP